MAAGRARGERHDPFSALAALALDLPAGKYTLRLGFVDPNSDQPALKLAIAGRDEEGWYALSEVAVGR